MQKTRSISADRAAALVLIVVFAAYGLYGDTLESSLGVDYIGPDFFPRAIGIIGVSLAALLLVQDYLRMSASVADQETGESQRSSPWFGLSAAAPFGMMLAYVASLEYVGFPIATVLFLTFSARFLGCPKWLWAAVFGLLSTLAAVLLFRYGLVLRLPQGLFMRLW